VYVCVCFDRFNSAKKDNDFVYHDKIPAFDSLPEIKGMLLLMHNVIRLCDVAFIIRMRLSVSEPC